jgi:hypothetical protein
MAVRTDALQNIVNVSWGGNAWLQLVLAYLAAEGSSRNEWQAYKWQALTDIIPGYVCADSLADTLQVPPIPMGHTSPTYPPQYASTLETQQYYQVGPNEGNNGYGATVLFNLGTLVGWDKQTSHLKNTFLVDFEVNANNPVMGGSFYWYVYYTISTGGAPGTPGNVIVSTGGNEDHLNGISYFQVQIDTDLTYTLNNQNTPY